MESNGQQDAQLTSYLKSMFTQLNGEDHSPPPPAPSSELAPAGHKKDSEQSEVPQSTPDINNNNNNHNSSAANSEAVESSLLPNGTIKVNVIVHSEQFNHSLEPVQPPLNDHQDDQVPTERAMVGHNKISLSFLDELKQTLQINKPQEREDYDEPMSALAQTPNEDVQNKESLGQPNESNESKVPLVNNGSLEPPAPGASESYASSVHDDESANEEVSVESGIELDDQSSSASESTTTTNDNHQPIGNGRTPSNGTEMASQSGSDRSSLTRSVSTDSLGSNAASRRVIMRSVSQDVKFKLESIKEEKKVTKTHVSELANFWKDRMISPKEKQ